MKYSRLARLSLITKTLIENPYHTFNLNEFVDRFGLAKSTLSEDIKELEDIFFKEEEGRIISNYGAKGGIFYAPKFSDKKILQVKEKMSSLLNDKTRIISDEFIFMNDLFYRAKMADDMAKALISLYDIELLEEIDNIVTIETKGIPLGLKVAGLINKPLIIIRKKAVLTEGTTLQRNYFSARTNKIRTMVLPIRGLKRGGKAFFVDDFMKGGSTAKYVKELLAELDIDLIGSAFALVTKEPKQKLIDKYEALVVYSGIDEKTKAIKIEPKLS